MKGPFTNPKLLLKGLLKPFVRSVFPLCPQGIIERAVQYRHSLLDYLPPEKKLIFRKYLGDIWVHIDTLYPIEREMLTGCYEWQTIQIINRFVKSGNVCFDVGANVGPLSFALAKRVIPDGRVYSFEPGSFLFRRLVSNVHLNPAYENLLLPFELGFSDRKETRQWNEDSQNRGNAGFLFQQPNRPESIQLIPLDDFAEEQRLQKLNFIKMDVEGMEYEVIKGGLRTIEKHKPILYYETGLYKKGFWAETLRGEKVILAIERLLEGLGYRFYKFESGELRETRYPELSYNTLAVCGGI
jgi:FkbM family methyltransferase